MNTPGDMEGSTSGQDIFVNPNGSLNELKTVREALLWIAYYQQSGGDDDSAVTFRQKLRDISVDKGFLWPATDETKISLEKEDLAELEGTLPTVFPIAVIKKNALRKMKEASRKK